ncbi:MAG: tRNA (N(6)-L-threonylcarbamoyladenosine(37)-C(2))-methylthiotransferase MtaB [Bacillota bacterium]
MLTVAFYTLGCKVNQYETEAMMDLFKEQGYRIVDFQKEADIYVVNSCTVTTSAASKSRKYARRAKRRNPEAVVAVVGCYPQVSPEEVKEIEEIDLVVGTDNKQRIVELIEKQTQERATSNPDLTEINPIKDYTQLTEYEDLGVKEFRQTTRANIKIEEGCNQFCSYCIIPYARGPVRSRSQDSVLAEVKKLTRSGIKEIVLTGIHLGAYGLDRDNEGELVELLKKLLKIESMGRIRLSSIEVTEVQPELLALMQTEEKMCKHLHLPLQSGSDYILDLMNRPYTSAEFREKVLAIKEQIPEIAITTDVIVGFPGEKEEHFQDTFSLVQDLDLSRLHVFPFSAREGTPAAEMENKVSSEIINQRSSNLRDLNKKLMARFQESFIGSHQLVVVEEKREQKTGLLTGITGNYIRVLLEGNDSFKNELVEVKLEDTINYQKVRGKIVKKKEF